MSAVKVSELEGFKGIDAEYYQPDDGLQVLLAQNIRANRLDFSFVGFFPPEVEQDIRQNLLHAGDVVMTRSGVNYGDTAHYNGLPLPLFAPADCLVIRTNAIPGSYLATYFNSDIGRKLIKRGAYGAAQSHIAPTYIETLRVPRNSQTEQVIESKLKQSKDQLDLSEKLYASAQALLVAELGLDKLDMRESLFSVQRASDVAQAGRADAEYHKRKYLHLLEYLSSLPHTMLDELASFSGGATPLGAEYSDEGIPFLRIQNVAENRLDLDDVVHIRQSTHEVLLRRSRLAPGDVLLTITGRIGTSAVVPDDLSQANINQHIVRLRLTRQIVNPYYLAAFLNSPGGKLQTEREAYGTTNEIERIVLAADQARKDAQRLLAEAKTEVERMIEEA